MNTRMGAFSPHHHVWCMLSKKLKDQNGKNLKDESSEIFRKLVKEYNCLEAKYYNFLPKFRLIFIDGREVAVSRYRFDEKYKLITEQGLDAPHLTIYENIGDFSLFDPFLSYFDHIWKDAKNIKNLKISKNGKI
jgi:hypothetical protein